MRLYTTSTAVTTTGGAGVSAGTGTVLIPVTGHLEWVYIDYHANAPATTDVTLAYAATPPGGNIIVRSNSATDGLFFPRAAVHTAAAAAITDGYDRYPVTGNLTVTIAQCDDLTAAVTVHVGVMYG